jgi:hypothetical protein
LRERDLLDRFGKKLRDETDRAHGQRQNACERAEADGLDEDDRDDHLVKRAAESDEEAHRPREPRRHEVTRREQPDGQREQYPQHRCDDRNFERLIKAFHHELQLVG